eukprot:989866-Pleurochrysis_carterae.AAC.1
MLSDGVIQPALLDTTSDDETGAEDAGGERSRVATTARRADGDGGGGGGGAAAAAGLGDAAGAGAGAGARAGA